MISRKVPIGHIRSGKVWRALIACILLAPAGFFATGLSGAATYAANSEAEDGVIAGNAAAADDPAASGGKAVRFSGGSPTAGGSCALPNYPTPACTGVPAGVSLQVLPLNDDGAYRVSTNGAIIDGKRIVGDLLITANDVTVKNSQVEGIIVNEYSNVQYKNTTIIDTTIGPPTGCRISPGIQNAEYTAIRVRLRGTDDGFRAGGPNITVKDSYVKNCGSADSHGDGIQDYPAVQNLNFEHNTMDLCGEWTVVPTSASQCNVPGHNSPIFVHSATAQGNGSTDVRIANNLALGGVASLYLEPAYGQWEIVGNRVVNNTWDFSAYETEGRCDNVDIWNDNRIVTINSQYQVLSTVATVPCS